MHPSPRWHRWLSDPWGQMVLYLLVFVILGLGVSAFFRWVRGPERSHYTPFNEGDSTVVDPQR